MKKLITWLKCQLLIFESVKTIRYLKFKFENEAEKARCKKQRFFDFSHYLEKESPFIVAYIERWARKKGYYATWRGFRDSKGYYKKVEFNAKPWF